MGKQLCHLTSSHLLNGFPRMTNIHRLGLDLVYVETKLSNLRKVIWYGILLNYKSNWVEFINQIVPKEFQYKEISAPITMVVFMKFTKHNLSSHKDWTCPNIYTLPRPPPPSPYYYRVLNCLWREKFFKSFTHIKSSQWKQVTIFTWIKP